MPVGPTLGLYAIGAAALEGRVVYNWTQNSERYEKLRYRVKALLCQCTHPRYDKFSHFTPAGALFHVLYNNRNGLLKKEQNRSSIISS